jgi:hypothetical protein
MAEKHPFIVIAPDASQNPAHYGYMRRQGALQQWDRGEANAMRKERGHQ